MGRKKFFILLLALLFSVSIASNKNQREECSLLDDFYMNLYVHKDTVFDITDKYMNVVLGYDISNRFSDYEEEIIDSDGDSYVVNVEVFKDLQDYYIIKKISYFAFTASGNIDLLADCVYENGKLKWINAYKSVASEPFSENGLEYTESCYRFYFDDYEKCIFSRKKSSSGSVEDIESVSNALDSLDFIAEPITNKNKLLINIKKILSLCR
jgi:hypothetical protein